MSLGGIIKGATKVEVTKFLRHINRNDLTELNRHK